MEEESVLVGGSMEAEVGARLGLVAAEPLPEPLGTWRMVGAFREE